MTVEVKKKKGESPESLFRRFTKQIQQSGLVLQVRKTRYKEVIPSRQKIKDTAQRRSKLTEKREYLKKIGKITDFADSFGARKKIKK
ncbi:MAG: hypothetical protein AAB526_03225 [Patescibacteria group bacterium]